MKKLIIIAIAAAAAFCAAVSCGNTVPLTMTKEEASFINNAPEVMRILTIDNEDDLACLRKGGNRHFNVVDINTQEFAALRRKLIKTLEASDGGVGLAAPQVGVNRNVIAVKRVDKEGEPIEVYQNIWIVEEKGEMVAGPEGCLSVPDARGDVMRYQDIVICYTDPLSDRLDQPREITEEVTGFTAVIFQHEIDHLNGILFTDKLQ